MAVTTQDPPIRQAMFGSGGNVIVKVWQRFFQTLKSKVDETAVNIATSIETATIASNAFTLTGTKAFRLITVSPAGTLSSISGGNAGEWIVLQTDDPSVVVSDGTSLRLQANFTMDNERDKLGLICLASGFWDEISRASNG